MTFHRQNTPADSVAVPPVVYDLGNLLVQNVAKNQDGVWTTAYSKLTIVKMVNDVWKVEQQNTQSLLKSKQFVEWLSTVNGADFL